MQEILNNLNQVFENRIRLAIMSILVTSSPVNYNTLRQTLSVTDGNLASHMATLEKYKYVIVTKRFIGRKPHTTYSATALGRRSFADHLDALKQLIRTSQ